MNEELKKLLKNYINREYFYSWFPIVSSFLYVFFHDPTDNFKNVVTLIYLAFFTYIIVFCYNEADKEERILSIRNKIKDFENKDNKDNKDDKDKKEQRKKELRKVIKDVEDNYQGSFRYTFIFLASSCLIFMILAIVENLIQETFIETLNKCTDNERVVLNLEWKNFFSTYVFLLFACFPGYSLIQTLLSVTRGDKVLKKIKADFEIDD